MDIVTHAMMGAAIAMPYLPKHPVAAAGFMLGSVLPDLDAFSRLFGKKAFLRCHQTYSHAIPIIAALVLVATGVLFLLDSPFLWSAVFVGFGMVLHTLLDAGNTYGITLWAPFNRRRICYEVVFFIDAITIVATVAALALQIWLKPAPTAVAAWWYPVFVLVYGCARGLLRGLAAKRAPAHTLSLIPSALWPWIFYGYKANGAIETFRLEVFSGAVSQQQVHTVRDAEFAAALEPLAEYRIMQRLSPAYHVVDAQAAAEGTRLVCRDLRTRNFGGSFGQLDVLLGAGGAVVETQFHV